MKFIVSVVLTLALLDLFHCSPLPGYKETETSSSWGYNAGINGGIGLEGGYKDGHGSLGLNGLLGVNIGGHKKNGQKDITYDISPQPYPQYGAMYMPRYPYPQYAQQLQYAQLLPFAPRYVVPQAASPWYYPQGSPQYVPQGAPAPYIPQGGQQYNPQGAPQNGTPNGVKGNTNEENTK